MKSIKQDFSKEELVAIISDAKMQKESEASDMDHFIEDVLEADDILSPIIDQPERKEGKTKRFRIPLLLCVTFFMAFFSGSLFGFFWGKSQANSQIAKELLIYEQKASSLIDEIKKLYFEPKNGAGHEEFIEPIFSPHEPERLALKVLR